MRETVRAHLVQVLSRTGPLRPDPAPIALPRRFFEDINPYVLALDTPGKLGAWKTPFCS